MPIPQVKINMFKCSNEINASEVISYKNGDNVIINNVIASKEEIAINNSNLTVKNSNRTFQINNPLSIKISDDIVLNVNGSDKTGSEMEVKIPFPKQDN